MIKIQNDWQPIIEEATNTESYQSLKRFLIDEYEEHIVYPPIEEIWTAFEWTPYKDVKVVIIGQDPYHGPGQAHGLSFSVQPGVRPPPSLQNIFKEIQRDLGHPIPTHGNLQYWAEQGVLLLNAVLTVTQGQAGAHANRGWEIFTSRIIEILNTQCEHLVFMLWGSYAQKKGQQIDTRRHQVLKSVHPSPLSAHRGFLGCGHFSAANAYLIEQGRDPIDWRLPAPE